MRMIHPAAWVGLFLNAVLAFMLYQALEVTDDTLMDAASQEAWKEFSSFMLGTIRPVHLTLLLAQAVALGLMVLRVPFSLAVAFITAFLTIPGSFVYLLGCLLTHYRIQYAEFPVAPPGDAGAWRIFPSFVFRKMLLFTAISFALCIILLALGDFSFSVTFFAAALVGLYCAYRAKVHPALSLYTTHCMLTVGLLAPRLLIPYDSVTLAILHDNESIQFEIRTPGGTRTLVWPLLTVAPAQRRQAVEELGAALDAHGVPLQ